MFRQVLHMMVGIEECHICPNYGWLFFLEGALFLCICCFKGHQKETNHLVGSPNLRHISYCGWTKTISHQLKTMGNHCWLLFTGESSETGSLRWCLRGFRPSTVWLLWSSDNGASERPGQHELAQGARNSFQYQHNNSCGWKKSISRHVRHQGMI